MISGVVLSIGIMVIGVSRIGYIEYGIDEENATLSGAVLCDVIGSALVVISILFGYGVIK